MTSRVLSSNVAFPRRDPGGADRVSGVDKRPQAFIDVVAPGPNYGDGSGVSGDVIGDVKHHGGAQKAVYAYEREELDYWGEELGRTFSNGSFGENLTVSGWDLSRVLINQRVRIGTAELEVSVVRQPCRTFAGWVGEPGWVRRFSRRGRSGAYLRVNVPGRIVPGDEIVLLGTPSHDIDMLTAFRAAQGDKEAARRVVDAACMPEMYHQRMLKLVG